MEGRWRKQGLLIPAPVPVAWATSHAMMPIADTSVEGVLRIWFTARDAEGRSQIGWADVAAGASGQHDIRYSEEPVLAPGPLGAFDDAGAMGSCLVQAGDRVLLYYIGWTRGVSVPFYTFVGCAVSHDAGMTFARVSPAPIMPRGEHDPYLTTTPWVQRDERGWRMWYTSGTRWHQESEGAKHWYHIKYAESDDGITWTREGHVAIDYAGPDEYAIARPCVLRDDGRYRMWFAHRGHRYRIGYAESDDGCDWRRMDARASIDVSEQGWDDDMIAYPCVFDQGGRRHMLYNGNGYGTTGIGHAVWEEERA